MTRILFDQFSKQFLGEILSALGTVEKSLEIPGESKFVDVYFAPAAEPAIDPQALGLLGKVASTPCLLEPFRNTPSSTEVRDCILKLFWVHADVHRRAKRENRRIPEVELPQLWILSPSASSQFLDSFAAASQDNWLPGIYRLGDALKTTIVAINQLPQTEETLWFRILGKGAIQQQAIDEVLAFAPTDTRRAPILKLLSEWKISLEVNDMLDNEDRQLMVSLERAYEEWEQELERRVIQQGIQQGAQAERRATIETLLRSRFGELDEELSAIALKTLELSTEDYTQLLLQLPQISREALAAQLTTSL